MRVYNLSIKNIFEKIYNIFFAKYVAEDFCKQKFK